MPITLSTGRVVYVTDAWEPSEGKPDEILAGMGGKPYVVIGRQWENAEKVLTPEERRELAEHMVGRWKQWGGLDGICPGCRRSVVWCKCPPRASVTEEMVRAAERAEDEHLERENAQKFPNGWEPKKP